MNNSEKQLNANRENAKRSTGPTTPEGKDTSSRNATRHGLTSRSLVLRPAQQAEFSKLHESLLAAWNPADAQEATIVLDIAEAQWRYQSALRALDQLTFSAAASYKSEQPDLPDSTADALALKQNAKDLLLYQRYAVGFERSMLRLIASLRQLQAFRMKKENLEREQERDETSRRDCWQNRVDFVMTTGGDFTRPEFHRLTDEQRERYIQMKREQKEEEN